MEIDLAGWRVLVGGQKVDLTPLEFKLLAYLARRAGCVVAYEELLEAVWNAPAGQGDPKWVIRCVSRLRKKLGENAGNPKYVVNVPGVGYRLRSPQP